MPRKSTEKKKAKTRTPAKVTIAVDLKAAAKAKAAPAVKLHKAAEPKPAPQPERAAPPEMPAPAVQPDDDAGALFVLGIRYSTGRDVDHDVIAAHKWFNLAAMMGHEGARSCRSDLASEMTAAQIAEAQRQARAWLKARDEKRNAGAEPKLETKQAVSAKSAPALVAARPVYVRRRAQAMRSAQSFARLCACA